MPSTAAIAILAVLAHDVSCWRIQVSEIGAIKFNNTFDNETDAHHEQNLLLHNETPDFDQEALVPHRIEPRHSVGSLAELSQANVEKSSDFDEAQFEADLEALQAERKKAVANEDYKRALELQQQEQALLAKHDIGEAQKALLERLDPALLAALKNTHAEKREAVAAEDFTKASELKEQEQDLIEKLQAAAKEVAGNEPDWGVGRAARWVLNAISTPFVGSGSAKGPEPDFAVRITDIAQDEEETALSEARKIVNEQMAQVARVNVTRFFRVQAGDEAEAIKDIQKLLTTHYDANLGATFLGGSCNPSTWRTGHPEGRIDDGDKDPSHGLVQWCRAQKPPQEVYNPQNPDWNPDLVALEAKAKLDAGILVFVVTGVTRAFASVAEIAFLIYKIKPPQKMITFIQPWMGENGYMEPYLKDFNRGTAYLVGMVENTPDTANVASFTNYRAFAASSVDGAHKVQFDPETGPEGVVKEAATVGAFLGANQKAQVYAPMIWAHAASPLQEALPNAMAKEKDEEKAKLQVRLDYKFVKNADPVTDKMIQGAFAVLSRPDFYAMIDGMNKKKITVQADIRTQIKKFLNSKGNDIVDSKHEPVDVNSLVVNSAWQGEKYLIFQGKTR